MVLFTVACSPGYKFRTDYEPVPEQRHRVLVSNLKTNFNGAGSKPSAIYIRRGECRKLELGSDVIEQVFCIQVVDKAVSLRYGQVKVVLEPITFGENARFSNLKLGDLVIESVDILVSKQ